jgi:TetR/AcrR family transcriptional repressor of mexJK operon
MLQKICKKKSAGRPFDEGKTGDIVRAASEAFFRDGFAQTSIESIAAAANVSKVTIYNRFGTKEALFVAAVGKECDTMREGLVGAMDSSGDIREQLTCFAMNMAGFLDREEITRLEAHLAVESQHNPELGKLFLDAGPRRLHNVLTELLDRAVAKGWLAIDDTRQAAEHFAGMVKGLADMERRFLQRHPDHDERTKKRIEGAVELFLNGCRAR